MMYSPLHSFIKDMLHDKGPFLGIKEDNHKTPCDHVTPSHPILDTNFREMLVYGLDQQDNNGNFRLRKSKGRWDSIPSTAALSRNAGSSLIAKPRRLPEHTDSLELSPRRLPLHTDSFQITQRRRRHGLSIPPPLFEMPDDEESITENASNTSSSSRDSSFKLSRAEYSQLKVTARAFEDIDLRSSSASEKLPTIMRSASMPICVQKPVQRTERTRNTISTLGEDSSLSSLISPRLGSRNRKGASKFSKAARAGAQNNGGKKGSPRNQRTRPGASRNGSSPLISEGRKPQGDEGNSSGLPSTLEKRALSSRPPSCPRRRSSYEVIYPEDPALLDVQIHPTRKTYPYIHREDECNTPNPPVQLDILQNAAMHLNASFIGERASSRKLHDQDLDIFKFETCHTAQVKSSLDDDTDFWRDVTEVSKELYQKLSDKGLSSKHRSNSGPKSVEPTMPQQDTCRTATLYAGTSIADGGMEKILQGSEHSLNLSPGLAKSGFSNKLGTFENGEAQALRLVSVETVVSEVINIL